jgi:hypothetical protein
MSIYFCHVINEMCPNLLYIMIKSLIMQYPFKPQKHVIIKLYSVIGHSAVFPYIFSNSVTEYLYFFRIFYSKTKLSFFLYNVHRWLVINNVLLNYISCKLWFWSPTKDSTCNISYLHHQALAPNIITSGIVSNPNKHSSIWFWPFIIRYWPRLEFRHWYIFAYSQHSPLSDNFLIVCWIT